MIVSESSGFFLLRELLVSLGAPVTGSREVVEDKGIRLKREGCVKRPLPLLLKLRADEKKGRASSSINSGIPEPLGRRRRGEKIRGEGTGGGGRGGGGENMERWLRTSVLPGISVK